MIARLSELLRHTLEGAGEQEVPLRAGARRSLSRYLEIMQIRFQGRLRWRSQVDAERARRARAESDPAAARRERVKHGVEQASTDGGPHRARSARRDGDDVVLTRARQRPGALGDDGLRTPATGRRACATRARGWSSSTAPSSALTLRRGGDGGVVAEVSCRITRAPTCARRRAPRGRLTAATAVADRRADVRVARSSTTSRWRASASRTCCAHEEDVEIVGMRDERRRRRSRRSARCTPTSSSSTCRCRARRGSRSCARSAPDAMPATIFVTAYDQYALQAFDVAAVDYLVKPFDDERFEQAFAPRAAHGRARGGGAAAPSSCSRCSTAAARPRCSDAGDGAAAPSPGRARRLPRAHRRRDARPGARGAGGADRLHHRERPVRRAAHGGARLSSSASGCRRSRSGSTRSASCASTAPSIVRLDLIDTLLRDAGGDYGVRLKGGVKLNVSRNRVEELERWMGLAK